ncbi:hypothetical protein PsorP6_006031 [Peronosclerospora sorghi]|uniref:Uncharacterized protein n=1 Tax=Peronosclerospora sorghi TaxID=230839 RepID=A0ACC0W4C7_9STRA|nr:hypothetical protein PsorP6_006031 [Peronosclerospora sorghi]
MNHMGSPIQVKGPLLYCKASSDGKDLPCIEKMSHFDYLSTDEYQWFSRTRSAWTLKWRFMDVGISSKYAMAAASTSSSDVCGISEIKILEMSLTMVHFRLMNAMFFFRRALGDGERALIRELGRPFEVQIPQFRLHLGDA